MKIGIMFPGQGSQYLGMGKAFYDESRQAQELFEEAYYCLEKNFVRLCFASSEKELREAGNAQTAIFLVSSAIWKVLKEKLDISPFVVAGHSAGQYGALYAAGGINFPDALYVLKKRSQFMQEATEKHPGGMSAVIGLSYEDVERVCVHLSQSNDLSQVIDVANINSPNQVVISGSVSALAKATEELRSLGGKVKELNVAGAFHSPLMREAEQEFVRHLVKVDFKPMHTPLIANTTAKPIKTPNEIQEELRHHMSSAVLWEQTMGYFDSCDVIVQVGPGKAMKSLYARHNKDKPVFAINEPDDVIELETFLTQHGYGG